MIEFAHMKCPLIQIIVITHPHKSDTVSCFALVLPLYLPHHSQSTSQFSLIHPWH